MNWREINDKYPNAFLEWLRIENPETNEVVQIEDKRYSYKVYTTESKVNYPNAFFLDESDIYQLPHYFDTLGIHVNTYKNDEAAKILRQFAGMDNQHDYSVSVKSPQVWEGETFPDRLAALEAGIIKAFELREMQMKTNG